MPNLSDAQLSAIAQEFHDLSHSVGQCRLDQLSMGVPLSDPELVRLLGLQMSLLNASSSFYMQAAKVTLDDADKAATQITSATTAANAALKTLSTVSKAISIASAAGVLAGAIMTGNMDQIGAAAKGVYSAIDV
jgi:hypothetical protein